MYAKYSLSLKRTPWTTTTTRVVGPAPSRDLTGLHNHKKIDVSNFTPAVIENYQPDVNETWQDLQVNPD